MHCLAYLNHFCLKETFCFFLWFMSKDAGHRPYPMLTKCANGYTCELGKHCPTKKPATYSPLVHTHGQPLRYRAVTTILTWCCVEGHVFWALYWSHLIFPSPHLAVSNHIIFRLQSTNMNHVKWEWPRAQPLVFCGVCKLRCRFLKDTYMQYWENSPFLRI